jgi:hypothetical protein
MTLKEGAVTAGAGALILVVLFFMAFGIKGCAGQSGFFSRWTGVAVKLPVPEDCVRIINFSKTGETKLLSYINDKGEAVMHEYSDHGVLEATYKIDGASFNADLTRQPANK